jgi:hypothetical protein
MDIRREEIRKSSYGGSPKSYEEIQSQKRNNYKKGGISVNRMERRESLYGVTKEPYEQSQGKTPPNPKRISSIKYISSKNNETNVAEAGIATVNNKMIGGIPVQKPSLNNNYLVQTMTTSNSISSSNPSYINNHLNMLRNQVVQNQEIQINNKSSSFYGMDNQNQIQTHSQIQNQSKNQVSYDIGNRITNVNNQMQMQSNLNKYPSSISSNNSNSTSKISKVSAINSTGMTNNYNYNNNDRRPSQSSLSSNKSSNRTPKFSENPSSSPASVYSNPRNQYHQYMNGAGSSVNNSGVNDLIIGSPHSFYNEQQIMNKQQQYLKPVQTQQISQQMKQTLQIQLMPEYQGQPTTPSQEYIEINNIPKSPAVELNSTYNPYDLRIKKPVLFSVKTLYDYEAASFEEVSFKANYVLPILAVQEDGWWETEINEMKANGTIGRRRGLIPSNFVEVINE